MENIILVGLGGFLGAISRFGVGKFFQASALPWATIIVNVTGCFAIGFLAEYFRGSSSFNFIRFFLLIGFLGAFTTFSTFSFETVLLIREGSLKLAVLNSFGNLFLCLVATYFGLWMATFSLR